MTGRHLLLLAALAIGLLAPTGAAAAGSSSLAAVRDATAPFHDLATAEAAHYDTEVIDLGGIACIDNPAGGMGIHYLNGSLLFDGQVSPTTPELLVYEPQANGRLRLVAVEYVVVQADWEAKHGSTVPSLFGQPFTLTSADNRYGLPAFYELHVWLWKHNPSGMFADWNPTVSCAAAG